MALTKDIIDIFIKSLRMSSDVLKPVAQRQEMVSGTLALLNVLSGAAFLVRDEVL